MQISGMLEEPQGRSIFTSERYYNPSFICEYSSTMLPWPCDVLGFTSATFVWQTFLVFKVVVGLSFDRRW